MKTIKYKQSSVNDGQMYSFFVNISDKHPTWYYTYTMTLEGFTHFLSICKDAGYEIVEEKLAPLN